MRGGLMPSRAAVSVMVYSPSARGRRMMSLCWWKELAARWRSAGSPSGAAGVAEVDPVLDGLDGHVEPGGGLGDGELAVGCSRGVADLVVGAQVAGGVKV